MFNINHPNWSIREAIQSQNWLWPKTLFKKRPSQSAPLSCLKYLQPSIKFTLSCLKYLQPSINFFDHPKLCCFWECGIALMQLPLHTHSCLCVAKHQNYHFWELNEKQKELKRTKKKTKAIKIVWFKTYRVAYPSYHPPKKQSPRHGGSSWTLFLYPISGTLFFWGFWCIKKLKRTNKN